jgi:hypothetical protein
LGEDLEPFLILYQKLSEAGKSHEDAFVISDYIDELDTLLNACDMESRKLSQLKLNIQNLTMNYQESSRQMSILRYNIEILGSNCRQMNFANQQLRIQHSQVANSIAFLKTVSPTIVKNMTDQLIQSVLARKRKVLTLAMHAVFQTILKDLTKIYLINSLEIMIDISQFAQENLEYYTNEYLDLIVKAYENLSIDCAQKVESFVLRSGPVFGQLVARSHSSTAYQNL